MKVLIIKFYLLATVSCFCQVATKRALFIGNSYTYVNNLPLMIAEMATSTADVLIYDSNTIGGYTFFNHCSNDSTIAKINQGNWDYVVLQEQSQRPAFPMSYVQNNVFPYAEQLSNLITTANPCTVTTFYMTWGRQNGDTDNCPFYAPLCTYEGMDDLLKERYLTMTLNNNAIVAPVGVVWRYIRENYPNINLYSSDGSHPSIEGSFVTACTFYTTFYRKDPTQITFNSIVSPTNASIIKQAVKTLVYNNLSAWSIDRNDPTANFTYSVVNGNTFQFINQSVNADNYFWDFGDGFTSTQSNPIHSYSTASNYSVVLQAMKCNRLATNTLLITPTLSNIDIDQNSHVPVLFSNPAKDFLKISDLVEEGSHYTISSLTGQQVQKGLIHKGNNIDISALNAGIYFIALIPTNKSKINLKFVKIN